MKKIATVLVLAFAVVLFEGCCARKCVTPGIGSVPPPPQAMKQLEK